MFHIEWTKYLMSLFSLGEKGCFVAVRPLELDVQATFCWFSSTIKHESITDWWMLFLYPASVVVSSVISSCFICKLNKSIKWAFSGNTLLSVPCGNSRSKSPPFLRNSNPKYLPMPSHFQFKDPPPPLPPLPSEFQETNCGMLWIFSGIAQKNCRGFIEQSSKSWF